MKYDAPTADEFSFVFDSWANSFRKSPWAGCVPNRLWDSVSRATAGEILDRGARVIVAHKELPDGKRRVAGYSVSEPGILHWLYVKRDYRGVGVGRALLVETARTFPAGPRVYTHRTAASAKFLGSSWRWDPVSARVLKAKP